VLVKTRARGGLAGADPRGGFLGLSCSQGLNRHATDLILTRAAAQVALCPERRPCNGYLVDLTYHAPTETHDRVGQYHKIYDRPRVDAVSMTIDTVSDHGHSSAALARANTLLRLINRLEEPPQGEVRINGQI